MLKFTEKQFCVLRQAAYGEWLSASFKKSALKSGYDSEAGVVWVEDVLGHRAKFSFDAHGFVHGLYSPMGRQWVLENDAAGKLVSFTSPAGPTLSMQYNERGAIREVARNRQKLLQVEYGEAGLPSRLLYPDGTQRVVQRSAEGRLEALTNRLGATEKYTYGPHGQLTCLEDGNGQQTHFEYGGFSQPERVVFPDGGVEAYAYDAEGRLSEWRAGGESLAKVQCDAAGRVTELAYADGTLYRRTYNEAGKLLTAEGPEGLVQYTYDDKGRVVEEKQAGVSVKYAYDANGALSALTYASGGEVKFSYDADGRPSSVVDWTGEKHLFSYSGQSSAVHSPNGLKTTVRRSDVGLPSAISVNADSGGEVASFQLGYDAEDRLTSLRDSRLGTWEYGYDAEGQLLSVDVNGRAMEAFGYDAASNRTAVNGARATFNSANQLLTQGQLQCAYDARGNLVSMSSLEGKWTYTYDARNLLVEANGPGKRIRFGYDALGRRIWKTAGDKRVRYVWAGDSLLSEVSTAPHEKVSIEYLYSPGSHAPLAARVNGRVYCYHNDGLGTPRRLTDESGAVVWAAGYSGFGQARVWLDNAPNALRFAGQQYDEETGLHYNRFRYYSPLLGRYLSRDCTGYLSGANLYAYAKNSPTNVTDALGLFWAEAASFAAAAVAGVAVGAAVILLAPVSLPALAVTAAAAVLGGAAAGAVGFGLNEALNSEAFCFSCVAKAMGKGAALGALAALPFVFLPATLGGLLAAGALSGAIGYVGDWVATPGAEFSWAGLAGAIGLGVGTAGLGRFLGPRLARRFPKTRAKLASKLAKHPPSRKANAISKENCCTTGHPVDVANGRVFTSAVDFELPGPLPLKFERTYYSSWAQRDSPLGFGWCHSFDERLWLEAGKVVFLAGDGREIEFDTSEFPQKRMAVGQECFDSINRLWLKCTGPKEWEVVEADGTAHAFSSISGDDKYFRLTRLYSRAGHEVTFRYNQRAHLEWVKDSAGRLVHFTCDSRGRVVKLALPHPSRASEFVVHRAYSYSSSGDLVRVGDAAGQPFAYEYRENLLVKETDRTGLAFHFEYTGTGEKAKCTRTWGTGGIFNHSLAYDEKERVTTVTNSLGAVTAYHMSEDGAVTKVVDALGGTSVRSYDESLRLVSFVNPLGEETTYEYDAKGNVTKVCQPDGAVQQVAYDENNAPVKQVDALGGVWQWVYDDKGLLRERTNPAGEKEAFEYKNGLLSSVTAADGNQTLLSRDEWKNVSSVLLPTGAKTQWTYDALGRLVSEVGPKGAEAKWRYDVLGRLVEVKEADGNVRQFTYDGEGNLLSARDKYRSLAWEYAGFHWPVRQRDADAVVRVDYDTEGQVVSIANENGETSKLERDECGRVRAEWGFDGKVRRYFRDASGRMVGMLKPGGQHSNFIFDKGGRLTLAIHSDGTQQSFAYRADGALLLAKNGDVVVEYERDALGRVLKEKQDGGWVSSSYDANGARAQVESSLGLKQAVQRDAVGNVKGVLLPGFEVAFERDALGLEVSRQLPGGVVVRQDRDEVGRPLLQKVLRGPSELERLEYQWGFDFRLLGTSDSAGAQRFQHDGRGRLISARLPDGRLQHRAMDGLGNLFRRPDKTDRKYGPGGRLDEAEGVKYVHDEDGQLVAKLQKDGGQWHYHYDASGQLVSVKRPDGKEVHYRYDALGRRVEKTFAGKRTAWVWDGDVPVHEVVSSLGDEAATPSPAATTWVFEPESFTPLAKLQGQEAYAAVANHLGTPVALYDGKGKLAWKQQLDTYGEAKTTKVSTDCPWRWPGQYEDEETGLYYNRFRYYDPKAGRYVTQDPIRIAGGLNFYGYVADPATWTDPLGLSGCPPKDAHANPSGREVQTTAIVPYWPSNNGFLGRINRITLEPGQFIDRYGGHSTSRFFSPVGTPSGARALPPQSMNSPLRTFEVLKPFAVDSGTVAPAFGQLGLGTQHRSDLPLGQLLERGFLREVTR